MKELNHEGCQCGFLVKHMWLLLNICQVNYTQQCHVNKDGVVVHGIGQLGQMFVVGAHLLMGTIFPINPNDGLMLEHVLALKP